jgi:CubicO group peptidase (beta-lactamase class C family)
MYSTVDDFFRFDQALYRDTLLSARSKQLMWQIVPSGNAYGWLVSNIPGKSGSSRLKVMSEGAVFGFFARFVRIPEERRTIILLTNVRGPTNFLPEIEAAILGVLDRP